ncbi:Aste57867_23741 [Aphanomyces stellatus]|uniref:Aste57867_23741 protein n=1 Tax=Aphanomyces stellatus TaxID=120398 RepID=A0A485LSZ6_9STRA|nr:hypothetical protein As57867_023669 [Aphanomyces stellatus]VFU00386.1 Aste57867_23741 [Aphanomyces stellatus]
MVQEIEDNLRDLFARDEDLRNDLAYICDLFSDSTDGDESAPLDAPPLDSRPLTEPSSSSSSSTSSRTRFPQQNESRNRQRAEMKRLRRDVEQLSETLTSMHHAKATRVVPSGWEQVARDEIASKNSAIHEHRQLRAQVDQNATFLDEMMHVLRKKPRLGTSSDMDSEAWREFKLAAQASLRVAAIHAIADREYGRMQSALVRAGLLGRVDDVIRTTPRIQPDNTIVVEYATHLTLPAPCHVVAAAIWRVFRGDYRSPSLPAGAEETWERIDDDTACSAFVQVDEHGHAAHSNFVAKHYVDPSAAREVVVWRSVLDDELVPRMTQGTVHDEWGCIAVVRRDDTSCYVKSLMHIGVGNQLSAELIQASERTDNCRTVQDMLEFPLESDAIPFAVKAFIRRGKEVEDALKCAVEDAIAEFERQMSCP